MNFYLWYIRCNKLDKLRIDRYHRYHLHLMTFEWQKWKTLTFLIGNLSIHKLVNNWQIIIMEVLELKIEIRCICSSGMISRSVWLFPINPVPAKGWYHLCYSLTTFRIVYGNQCLRTRWHLKNLLYRIPYKMYYYPPCNGCQQ